MTDEVAVGSLESNARGQGARKNAGKPQWWQFPWWTVANIRDFLHSHTARTYETLCSDIFDHLATWQRGGSARSLEEALALTLTILNRDADRDERSVSLFDLREVVKVLEFGAKKYPACPPDQAVDSVDRPTPASAGNWAKGMAWSVCFACAMSHLLKISQGSERDEESGLFHSAHLACNLVFLLAYQDIYPEGDDRIPGFRPGGVGVDVPDGDYESWNEGTIDPPPAPSDTPDDDIPF